MAQDLLPFLPTNPAHRVPDEAPALFDDTSDAWMSYGALRSAIRALVPSLKSDRRNLVLCCLPRTIEAVTAYLACAENGHAIALADPASPNLQQTADAYEAEWIAAPKDLSFAGYESVPSPLTQMQIFKRQSQISGGLHPDFYLMLLTSGSTGSSKGVRLSYKNIASNTLAIIDSLHQTADVTALCHLPIPYSFGLSVLQTQLAVGGRCVLTEESLMSAGFWNLVRAQHVTLFPGVPYHYEMLARLGLARLKAPELTTFIQAGGKMQVPLTQRMLEEVTKREGGELFIMYGQTEASPRISCFPLHLRPEKIGSSGVALPGGKLEIIEDEIIYSGPNVMMGIAQSRADLAQGDVMGGRLATGDLGTLDEEGFLTITGRKQRFAKMFGQRVALDDLERIAAPLAFAIAVEHPEKVVLLTQCADPVILDEIKARVVEQTKLPAPWIEVRTIADIPHKASGKIDYQKIQSMIA